MGVAENIRRLRNESEMTQEQLAERIGVARSTVAQWERGWTKPRMGMVSRLAAAFGTTPSAIVAEPGASHDDAFVGPAILTLHSIADAGSDVTGAAQEAARKTEVPISLLVRHPHARAVLMEGDAMDRMCPPGMVVVFDPDLEPTNGRIAVVETRGQVVIRRLFRGNGTMLLVADSHQAHDDIVLAGGDDARLLGTVIWVQCPKELA